MPTPLGWVFIIDKIAPVAVVDFFLRVGDGGPYTPREIRRIAPSDRRRAITGRTVAKRRPVASATWGARMPLGAALTAARTAT